MGADRCTLDELVRGWTPYADDLLLHDPGGPGECLVRRGELVIGANSLDPVVHRLRRWVEDIRHDDELALARLRLRSSERDRCVDIARDTGRRVPDVSANHVHLGSPVMFGAPVMFGTGADAAPAAPVEKPPDQRWDRRVVVGVLDTGLDRHPWFRDRPWFQPLPEVLDADDDSGQDRQAGHGTFVSGVLLQHAPGALLRPRRVLSSLGFTDDVTIVAGLRSLRHGGASPDVLLFTSGCHTADDTCPPALRQELAQHPGSVVIAAAGNQAVRRPFWPAALPTVVGVAATRADGRIAEFSNTGDWVDAAAPGVDVVSSFVRLRPAGAREFCFARWSGTSFAAPRVAAAAADALHSGDAPASVAEIVRRRYPIGR